MKILGWRISGMEQLRKGGSGGFADVEIDLEEENKIFVFRFPLDPYQVADKVPQSRRKTTSSSYDYGAIEEEDCLPFIKLQVGLIVAEKLFEAWEKMKQMKQ